MASTISIDKESDFFVAIRKKVQYILKLSSYFKYSDKVKQIAISEGSLQRKTCQNRKKKIVKSPISKYIHIAKIHKNLTLSYRCVLCTIRLSNFQTGIFVTKSFKENLNYFFFCYKKSDSLTSLMLHTTLNFLQICFGLL